MSPFPLLNSHITIIDANVNITYSTGKNITTELLHKGRHVGFNY